MVAAASPAYLVAALVRVSGASGAADFEPFSESCTGVKGRAEHRTRPQLTLFKIGRSNTESAPAQTTAMLSCCLGAGPDNQLVVLTELFDPQQHSLNWSGAAKISEVKSQTPPCFRSSRSSCAECARGTEIRAREKARLRSIAENFFERAHHGIDLLLFDFSAASFRPCVLQLDHCFTNLYISWGQGIQHVLALDGIYPPCMAGNSLELLPDAICPDRSVLLETIRGEFQFVWTFPSVEEAEDFLTGLTILRLAVLAPVAKGL